MHGVMWMWMCGWRLNHGLNAAAPRVSKDSPLLGYELALLTDELTEFAEAPPPADELDSGRRVHIPRLCAQALALDERFPDT